MSLSKIGSVGLVPGAGLPDAIDVNASAPADSLAINASGQIGVGTTTTTGQVNIAKSGGNQLSLIDSSGSSPGIRFANSSNTALGFIEALTGYGLSFFSGSTERMRIDSSGNVGIGTNSPAYRLHAYSNTSKKTAMLENPSNDYAGLVFKSNGTEYGNITVANDGMQFYWGSGATTERMRIDSSGNLLVGGTNTGGKINITGKGAEGWGAKFITDITSSTYYFINFCKNDGSATQVGSISASGSTTSYNTSSDYRLKENIAPMTGALATVAQLKPVTYTWKADGSAGQGFIAHELQAVVPDCVTGEKDAEREVDVFDDDGNKTGTKMEPVYQGVDTSFLVATLTAAIQELKAELDAAKERIAALESNNV